MCIICVVELTTLYVAEVVTSQLAPDSLWRPTNTLWVTNDCMVDAWYELGRVVGLLLDLVRWEQHLTQFMLRLKAVFDTMLMPWLRIFTDPLWDLGGVLLSMLLSPLYFLTGFEDGLYWVYMNTCSGSFCAAFLPLFFAVLSAGFFCGLYSVVRLQQMEEEERKKQS